jgi:DNA-directed RNA polymerase specialized sigma24 family protein
MPHTALTSQPDVTRSVGESRREFTRFFETWFGRVYAYALRRGRSRAAAERVTEEVLLRAVAAGADRSTESAAAAYLFACLRALERSPESDARR